MKNEPGYPLPDGELGEDEIVCQLVYLPDRPEYWQAFLGSLHYMTTWRAWARDDDKRGKDAASNWRAAFELTIGCWRMTCLQELQENVAEILAIMQLGSQCCDGQDITDGDRYTDRVEDGVGDVPQNIIDAGYADDAADWDGFDGYKCVIVHVTVNQMEARLREIADVVDSAGPYLGVAAALSAIIGIIVASGGLAIVFGIVAGVGAVSALYFGLIEFGPVDDLADEVAANHDELACAMYQADGDVGALVALNDKIDELFSVAEALILKNLNNGPTLKALYAGRYDQQDIAAELEAAGYDVGDFDCSCILQIGEYTYTETWDDVGDWKDWTHGASDGVVAGFGNPDLCIRGHYSTGYAELHVGYIAAQNGLSNPANRKFAINRIIVQRNAHATHAGIPKIGLRTNGTGAPWVYETFSNVKVWTDSMIEYLVTPRPMDNSGGFRLESRGGASQFGYWDNICVDFDTWLE